MKIKRVNPVAKHSRNRSGAGAHKSKKDYKRREKHIGLSEESIASKVDRLVLLERMQENTNSPSNWFMYEEEIQVIKQYLSEVEV